MPLVASKAPYTLLVVEDDLPLNPREDYENFGKMVCWHSRYNLGDPHVFAEPGDFLRQMLSDMYADQNGRPIYDFLKSGKAAGARLQYNPAAREWELLASSDWLDVKGWYKSSSYPAALKGRDIPDSFFDDCLSALKLTEMQKLLMQSGRFAMLPLYLYDHSGLTIRTAPFSCPWDSGQVGWIYADKEMMEKEYGAVTPETIARTMEVLEREVEAYDYYLTGQCYGFQLFEGAQEIDSCWGFLGDIHTLQEDIRSYLPEGCESLVEDLRYEDRCFDIDDYLEEAMQEPDDEYDAEL